MQLNIFNSVPQWQYRKNVSIFYQTELGGIDMKKVLLGLSALAMAFSISTAGFADTLLVPATNSCGCLKQSFAFYQQMPVCVQPRIFSYYQPIAKCCPAAPCCAAPVQPCCEQAKPCGCGCGCHKKHKKVKKVKCSCGK